MRDQLPDLQFASFGQMVITEGKTTCTQKPSLGSRALHTPLAFAYLSAFKREQLLPEHCYCEYQKENERLFWKFKHYAFLGL